MTSLRESIAAVNADADPTLRAVLDVVRSAELTVASVTAGRIRAVGAEGQPVEIGVVPLAVPSAGDSADVRRLYRAIEGAMDRWRFVAYLRRPVPTDFDPSTVARAVQMWRLSMERGDWKGRHAIYDDEGLCVEFSVVGEQRAAGRGGLLWSAPPLAASESIEAMYHAGASVLEDLRSQQEACPVILAVVAAGWCMPQGHAVEALYGRPEQVVTERDASSARASLWVRRDNQGLYADADWRSVQATWWIDGRATDRAVAHDNPWFEGHRVGGFSGRRLSRFDAVGSTAHMAWFGPGYAESSMESSP